MSTASHEPTLSVVMPVHNGADYLQESIQSILSQTHAEFEFVIVDDGSTDRTPEILQAWATRDPRVRVVRTRSRLGVVGSANRAVAEARAPVCARMDADDVSHPDRLRRQWAVLQAHPEACLVGTLAELVDARGRVIRPRDRSALLSRGGAVPPFPHGSIMFRRRAFEAVGGYRPACAYWEDRDLFLRLAEQGKVLVLPAALYQLRCHAGSIRLSVPAADLREAFRLMQRCLDLYRAGRDYTSILEGDLENGRAGEDITLNWLGLVGQLRLWAGLRPGILRDLRSLDRVHLNGLTLPILALATLGQASPALYRLLLRGVHRLRDWRAGAVVDEWKPVEWRFA